MFASAGKSLNFHAIERGCLKTISTYFSKSTDEIKCVSWCHDNSYIAILHENGDPEIVCSKDPSNVNLVHIIYSMCHTTSIKFKRHTKRILALGNKEGEVILYDTKSRSVAKHLGQLSSEIISMEFNHTDKELAVISNKMLVIFNLCESNETNKVQLENPEICSVIKFFNKNQTQIAVGCINGMIIVWDTNEKLELRRYHIHSAEVTGIAFSKDDKLMVTCGRDNKIGMVGNSRQECFFRKVLHQPVTSIDISSNDQHMIVGLQDGSVYVYNMFDHLKPIISTRIHPFSVNQIAFINGLELEMLERGTIDEHSANVANLIQSKSKENIEEKICESPKKVPDENFVKAKLNRQEPTEMTEENLKSNLLKVINSHFEHLEDQLADHCAKLQALISNELDALYSVAARWECFKTMEMEEIVHYICGIVTTPSEDKTSEKSENKSLRE